MVRKLMESFDVDAALLACFSDFDPATLIVTATFGDVNEQLDSVEADLGIDQGWNADLEGNDGNRVNVVSHSKDLAMTLCNRIKDVDYAAHRGPSRQSDFSQSTENLTNNLEAMIPQHTPKEKALKNIHLIEKNYTLENTLLDTCERMALTLALNKLLQVNWQPSTRFHTMVHRHCPMI
jgi:hypothetical protein